MAIFNPVNGPYLTDNTGTLISLQSTYSFEDYNTLLQTIEVLLNQLFAEVESAETVGEAAITAAYTALQDIQSSYQDLVSSLNALQAQVGIIATQSLPITGGQYTHIITDAFQTGQVRDTGSSYSEQPITLYEPNTSYSTGGCPPRPDLSIDSTTQTLQLKREGLATILSATLAQSPTPSIGGNVTVDKIFGTPTTSITRPSATDPWVIGVSSKTALTSGFSQADVPSPAWVPNTYTSGGAVRIHAKLENPSPITKIRLRGSTLPGGAQTQLLETVGVVDSRVNPSNPASHPTRNVNIDGTFTFGTAHWTPLYEGQVTNFVTAPGRSDSNDQALITSGGCYQTIITLPASNHMILRYHMAVPFTDINGPSAGWAGTPGDTGSPIPTPPLAGFVQVYYYSSIEATFGIDSPLDVETFQDPLLSQGGLYAGYTENVHLLSIPTGTKLVILLVGIDPLAATSGGGYPQNNAQIAYSDVWVTDEAITTTWSETLPQPVESNNIGPTAQGSAGSFTADDAVDYFDAPIGNTTSLLIFSDVWVTLGQQCPYIDSAANWKVLEHDFQEETPTLPPYQLSVPTNINTSKDPIILHQARYVGKGPTEWDAGRFRLNGNMLDDVFTRDKRKFFETGRKESPWNRANNSFRLPALDLTSVGRWWNSFPLRRTLRPGVALLQANVQSQWGTLYGLLLNYAKSNQKVPAQMTNILAMLSTGTTMSVDTGSLYVYLMGISSLKLLREEYADSGIYVTQPLLNTATENSGGIDAEIHEVVPLTSPAIPTFLNRIRFWGVPGGNLEQDTPLAVLQSAIPLDSVNPRITFHSTSEIQPGISPATSDLATQFGYQQPAFYVTPAFQQDTVSDITAYDDIGGIPLSYVPYINQEAIQNIIQTIAGYDVSNPNVYDPNAIRPIVDFLTPFNSSISSGVDSQSQVNVVYPGTPCTVQIPFQDQNQKIVGPESGDKVFWVLNNTPDNSSLSTGSIDTSSSITITGASDSFGEVTSTGSTYIYTFNAPEVLGSYVVQILLQTELGAQYLATINFTVVEPANGSTELVYINGYRPIAVLLKLPSGRYVYPDSLGASRPGELAYQSNEILNISIVTNTQSQSGNAAEYASSTSGDQASSTLTSQTSPTSYQTTYYPIAGGAQGMSIDLYWHQSSQFDPASGGIINTEDILIAPADYTINQYTGQITVNAQPPYGWSAYDQILANYYWVVGNIAPREWFPNPAIGNVLNSNNPNDFQITSNGNIPQTLPPVASQAQSGNIELTQNPYFQGSDPSEYWTTAGSTGLDPGTIISNGKAIIAESSSISQSGMGYAGPGLYNLTIVASSLFFGGGSIAAVISILDSSSSVVYTIPLPELSTTSPVNHTYLDVLNGCTISESGGGSPYTITLTVENGSTQGGSQVTEVSLVSEISSRPLYVCNNSAPNYYYPTFSSGSVSPLQYPNFEEGSDWQIFPEVDTPIPPSTGGIIPTPNTSTQFDGYNSITIPPGQSAIFQLTSNSYPVIEFYQQYNLYYWLMSTGAIYTEVDGELTRYPIGTEFTETNTTSGTTTETNQITFNDFITTPGVWQQIGHAHLITGETSNGIVFTIQNTTLYPIYIANVSLVEGIPSTCNLYVLPQSTSTVIDVTSGSGAGVVEGQAPSSVSDLFNGPLSQAYPVTRNVTNYTSSISPNLNPPNFDPTSPNYYPVIEYVILPGGKVVFGMDFALNPNFAGTEAIIQYEYLPINPRVILEVVPLGQTCFSSPQTYSEPSLYPAGDTPKIDSIYLLLNATT